MYPRPDSGPRGASTTPVSVPAELPAASYEPSKLNKRGSEVPWIGRKRRRRRRRRKEEEEEEVQLKKQGLGDAVKDVWAGFRVVLARPCPGTAWGRRRRPACPASSAWGHSAASGASSGRAALRQEGGKAHKGNVSSGVANLHRRWNTSADNTPGPGLSCANRAGAALQYSERSPALARASRTAPSS